MLARARTSAPNAQPLDQILVADFVSALDIIEQLATLGHELEQPASRVVILHVRLEMLSQVADPLRQDRHLHFRRTSVAALRRICLDDFRLAAGRDRHRHAPFRGPALPVRPVRLNTRLGTISPRSTSARAMSPPEVVTYTVPRKMGASRPRNSTAWPRCSLAASARLTASAGMSSSAVSTGMSASAKLPSPVAALWHKAESCSSEIMCSSPNGPTAVRRSADTWPRQPSSRPISRASART